MKREINNFDHLLSFVKHLADVNICEPEYFYQIQILRRKKDGNDTRSHKSELMQAFYVHSEEYYREIQGLIIDLCNLYNARAYINLNKKSYQTVAKLCVTELQDKIFRDETCVNASNVYNSCASKADVYGCKVWVVDIDTHDVKIHRQIADAIYQIGGAVILATVQTYSGIHYLTRPFNRADFAKLNLPCEIKTNSQTLLYANLVLPAPTQVENIVDGEIKTPNNTFQ